MCSIAISYFFNNRTTISCARLDIIRPRVTNFNFTQRSITGNHRPRIMHRSYIYILFQPFRTIHISFEPRYKILIGFSDFIITFLLCCIYRRHTHKQGTNKTKGKCKQHIPHTLQMPFFFPFFHITPSFHYTIYKASVRVGTVPHRAQQTFYKNLYTILGMSDTPIITPIIAIPTGRRTPRLSFKVVVIGASISAVTSAPFIPLPPFPTLKPHEIFYISVVKNT